MARSTKYSRELRERAVALVFEQVKTGEYGSQWEVDLLGRGEGRDLE